MKKRKISLSDFDIYDFKLIGLHSQLEPYKIAYFINQTLGINFEREPKDLELMINHKKIPFPAFKFFSQEWDIVSYLICNRVNVEDQIFNNGLFTTLGLESQQVLLSDYKQVDYFLKINDELNIFNTKDIINQLIHMRQVSTAYSIDPEAIKHPEHLILD